MSPPPTLLRKIVGGKLNFNHYDNDKLVKVVQCGGYNVKTPHAKDLLERNATFAATLIKVLNDYGIDTCNSTAQFNVTSLTYSKHKHFYYHECVHTDTEPPIHTDDTINPLGHHSPEDRELFIPYAEEYLKLIKSDESGSITQYRQTGNLTAKMLEKYGFDEEDIIKKILPNLKKYGDDSSAIIDASMQHILEIPRPHKLILYNRAILSAILSILAEKDHAFRKKISKYNKPETVINVSFPPVVNAQFKFKNKDDLPERTLEEAIQRKSASYTSKYKNWYYDQTTYWPPSMLSRWAGGHSIQGHKIVMYVGHFVKFDDEKNRHYFTSSFYYDKNMCMEVDTFDGELEGLASEITMDNEYFILGVVYPTGKRPVIKIGAMWQVRRIPSFFVDDIATEVINEEVR